MLATRTIGVALVIAFGVALGLLGCEEEARAPARRSPRAQSVAALASSAVTPPLAPAVLETLRSVHERALDITAPTTPLARLAFGADRLLQATSTGAVFRETKLGEVVAERELGAVFAVAHGVDGSLFALGSKGGVRLEARSNRPRSLPRVPFLPGSSLLANLENPGSFYVYYSGERQLYRYPFAGEAPGLLPFEERFTFDGCEGPLVALRDGAFVCRTAQGLLRKAPLGKRSELRAPELEDLIRIVPAKRLDEVYLVSRAGRVTRRRLVPGLPVLADFTLPAPPYAVAANEEALAFVLVSRPTPAQPRRWSLLVTGLEGEQKLSVELASPAARADDGWLEAELEDKNLAISTSEPIVAVGGAKRVAAFSYATGAALFAR